MKNASSQVQALSLKSNTASGNVPCKKLQFLKSNIGFR